MVNLLHVEAGVAVLLAVQFPKGFDFHGYLHTGDLLIAAQSSYPGFQSLIAHVASGFQLCDFSLPVETYPVLQGHSPVLKSEKGCVLIQGLPVKFRSGQKIGGEPYAFAEPPQQFSLVVDFPFALNHLEKGEKRDHDTSFPANIHVPGREEGGFSNPEKTRFIGGKELFSPDVDPFPVQGCFELSVVGEADGADIGLPILQSMEEIA